MKTTKKTSKEKPQSKPPRKTKKAAVAGSAALGSTTVGAQTVPRVGKLTAKMKIPQEQWALPAGFTADGTRLATLKELADPAVPTMSLAQMSPTQRAELVSKRIEMQPKFDLAMVGAGVVDKQRAISEVKAQTDIGRVLMEIEQNAINFLLDAASK